MNKRKLISVLLITALAMLILAGCGPKDSRGGAALTWDGSKIVGAPYYERRMETVIVHYTPPTTPEKVELLAILSNRILTGYKGWGELDPSERVDVWVLPSGITSVDGFKWLLKNQRAQAGGPNVVIIKEEAIPATELDQFAMQVNGYPEALAVAVTQPAASPVFEVHWLHEGMGSLHVGGWVNFPAAAYARNTFMFIQRGQKPLTAAEIIDRLSNPDAPPPKVNQGPYPPSFRQASVALAGLMVDRWGVDWPEVNPRTAEQLAPAEALKWAMGVTDEQKAMGLFDDRMVAAIEEAFLSASGRAGLQSPPTMALRGYNRIQPQAIPGPGTGPLAMPAYVVDLELDPDALTLVGEEAVTWTNSRADAVNRLYFTVWGNNEFAKRYGGESTVESVTVEGAPVAFSFKQMDLEIPLEKLVQPGESVTVTVKFRTKLPQVGFRPPRPGQLPGTMATEPDVGVELSALYPTLAKLDGKGWQLVSHPLGVYADPGKHLVRIRAPKGTKIGLPSRDRQNPTPPPQGVEDGDTILYEFDWPVATGWNGYLLPQQKGK